MRKSKTQTEFGDFQTPLTLARRVCSLINRLQFTPQCVLEPTCGTGTFLRAASNQFPHAKLTGVEINGKYLAEAARLLPEHSHLIESDFFQTDWQRLIDPLPEPLLIIGNPPWVTNSQLGSIKSNNVPEKSNNQNFSGIESITGKSNFDISEWMINHMIDLVKDRKSVMAFLCKTSVARRLIERHWNDDVNCARAAIYTIDAQQDFGVAVDACLFLLQFGSPTIATKTCDLFRSLESTKADRTLGIRNGNLVNDTELFDRLKHLAGNRSSTLRWRSGIKHDCARVMEFVVEDSIMRNGFGEVVDIEPNFVYPLLKSSHLASGKFNSGDSGKFEIGNCTSGSNRAHLNELSHRMLVTQKKVGEATDRIETEAPKTWAYLRKHATLLSARKSSIYQNRPEYSIFGVGDYSFAKWKVAISGFYKSLKFRLVAPYQTKPVMLDDTAYFIPCADQHHAQSLATYLNSDEVQQFLQSQVFWDSKRPVTAKLLSAIDLSNSIEPRT